MRRDRSRGGRAALALAVALLIPSHAAAQEPGQPMPPAHPPAGSAGHGRPHEAAALGMEPPQDDVQEAPDLPPGTIEVFIRDARQRPVDAAPVVLGVLHNSVATGEQRERLNATTDARGVARFEALKIGAAHSYAVSSTRGPSRYEADPFNLPEKGGRRVILHVFDTVTDLEDAQIGIRAMAYLSLKEDAIQVENMLEVFNLGDRSWQAEVPVALPPDFRAFNKGEDGGVANVDAAPQGYVLRGTFKPGRTPIGFRYQVPLTNDASQTIDLTMPPRVAQARVIAEASKQMELSVEGAQPARRTRNRDGQAVLVSERVAMPGERGMPVLAVTLRGLPTKGPGRYIAVALAAGLLVAGALYVGSKRDAAIDDEARDDLVEAREALLREIVSLERAHRRGEVGPKSYQRVRAAMLDALAQIVAQLDRSPAPALAGGPAPAAPRDAHVHSRTEEAPPGPERAQKKRKRRAKAPTTDVTEADPS